MPKVHARHEHRSRTPRDRTPSLRSTRSSHIIHHHLTSQANILVDENGTALIAGLGSASVLSHSAGPTAEGRTSAGRLSRSDAPEVVRGSSLPTKASDMYAFGVMTWEVRVDLFVWNCSVCSFETGSHWATPVLRDDRDRSNVLDGERGQAIAVGPPRNRGSNLGYGRTVLAHRALEAGVS
jgi:serine/threonine protein kinase